MATILRTPDGHFARLPGRAWAPRYLARRGLRVHDLDEEPEHDAPGAALTHWGGA